MTIRVGHQNPAVFISLPIIKIYELYKIPLQ
jgi:hypothetical protein